MLDWGRFLETSSRIRLALPSRLEEWGAVNQDAAATYNDWINTIVLKPEAMGRDEQGRFRLPTVQELRERNAGNLIPVLPTIVHEMAHAEFDFFVEEGATPEDAWLFRSMQTEMAEALETFNPSLGRRTLKVALSELFAYFRGDFLTLLLEDWDELIFLNGYSRQQDRCSRLNSLRKEAQGMPLEEFRRVVPAGQKLDAPYRERARLSEIWVKGQEVSLKGVTPAMWDKLWAHLQHFQRPPRNKRELAGRVAQAPWIAQKILRCREAIWREAQ
ncbi:MAG: hypothetical protein HUU37_07485 [Bdellovibrionales bacterium]|nr:hypothetical protein [Bdellovibrionales bacterium]